MNNALKRFFITIILFISSCYYIESHINSYYNYNFEYILYENNLYTEYLMFDYLPFFSIEEVSNFASHIIRGEVLDYRVAEIDISLPLEFIPPEFLPLLAYDGERGPIYEIFTVYRIKISEVFKGEGRHTSDIIEVRIRGGQLGNLNVVSLAHTQLTVGDDLIFFIVEPRVPGIPFFLASASQAVYRVIDEQSQDGLIRGLGAITFESLSQNNSLTLTLEDLERITSENE